MTSPARSPDADGTAPVRAADIAAAMCLATDLGMGFPWGHGLAATLATMRLCDYADADAATARDAYYLSLLVYAGCTSDAIDTLETFGGPFGEEIADVIWGGTLEQMRVVVRNLPAPGASPVTAFATIARGLPRARSGLPEERRGLCDVARLMSQRLGTPETVGDALHLLTERWDGKSVLKRARGDQLPRALRIALVARDASYLAEVGGIDHAVRLIAKRAGRAHDPEIATIVMDHAQEILGPLSNPPEISDLWSQVLAAEKGERAMLKGEQVDDALGALGDFADLLTPSRTGHALAVSTLAERAATRMGLATADVVRIRRAALVQDVGRAAIPAAVWERSGRFSAADWEQVRLHPYYTERVCSASPFLRDLAPDAGCHHERLDGSGYFRGARGEALPASARVLAAADALQSLRERAPGREPLTLADASEALADEARDGRLDTDAVAAVIEAAGGDPPKLERPAGLTDREAQVVTLLARGLATKQLARALGVTPKTADHHIQNAYRKMGVSSRAGATVFAMEHGLINWGELPMGGRTAST
ncbi:HD domain-containing phosphohydrolase [Demequina sp.]|uniref:HD domain-containing phosphohydrolase n=1 Tax=Demequina sp. TaxID=2050685 RepID=UPI0025FFDC43|nr:HD domain-containing phosphohydrolase [Demequina sp.]